MIIKRTVKYKMFEKELQEIIRKNLPENTANELRKYLDSVEDIKKKNIKLEADNDTLKLQLENQIKKVTKLEYLEKLETELKTKTEKLNKDIDKFESDKSFFNKDVQFQLQNVKLQMMERNVSDIFTLVNKVFSLPQVTVHNTKNVPVVVPVNENGTASITNDHFVSETTNTTVNKL